MALEARERGMMSRSIGRMYQRGSVWWIDVSADGRRVRQSTGSTKHRDAVKLLKQRTAEIQDGRFQPDSDRLTFDGLEKMIRDHYTPKRSLERVEIALKHLRKHLGLYRAKAITFDRLTAYRNARLEEGAAPATVKYELATLRKGLTIAERSGKLLRRPPMPEITVNNVRTGFFEADEFKAVKAELPTELQGVVEVAYLTGWRVPSELLTLCWSQVDLKVGMMRLEPGTTKNNEGREFPFDVFPELRAVIEAQRKYTDDVAKRTGKIPTHVFHRNGVPIRDCYAAWRSACCKAGLEGKLMHDFRRTAVRNLERAGVSRSVAMKLTGHKTESVFQRYAIVSEADLREGVAKRAALVESIDRSILPLRGTNAAQSGGTGV